MWSAAAVKVVKHVVEKKLADAKDGGKLPTPEDMKRRLKGAAAGARKGRGKNKGSSNMFRLFSFLATTAAIIIGVGFYLGWFTVTPTGKSADGSSTYSLTINKNKIREDINKGKEEVKHALDSARTEGKKLEGSVR